MDYFEELLRRYRKKGLLIDTNLLLLYFVGRYDPNRISKFKRTMIFTIKDFYILSEIFEFFAKVVTTPNILTEVSNLSNQLPNEIKPSYFSVFAKHLVKLEENYITSIKIGSLKHFKNFGLTDSGIIDLVKDKYLVLTDDLRLAAYLQNARIDVINFNNIRALNW
ncbi:MAG: PIN domain-containing protein [Pyrinomonadaceae bacterium]